MYVRKYKQYREYDIKKSRVHKNFPYQVPPNL